MLQIRYLDGLEKGGALAANIRQSPGALLDAGQIARGFSRLASRLYFPSPTPGHFNRQTSFRQSCHLIVNAFDFHTIFLRFLLPPQDRMLEGAKFIFNYLVE